ncbi:MAG: FlgD immunoglobulin-like domain containing protein [candidate division KSB1 bacterium]|nr:FlgD immunoglobulin-like domain containing protein [candidate division KSB1 bacterium]
MSYSDKRTCLFLLVFLLCVSGGLMSQTSDTYMLKRAVTDAGGGRMASGQFASWSSAGEPVSAGMLLSENYRIEAGFWAGVDLVTGVDEDPAAEGSLPMQFYVRQNYPNPFNPATTIEYALPHGARVSLIVYAMTGRRIKVLISNRQDAGVHQVVWDGTDHSGRRVASGVYVYRLLYKDAPQNRVHTGKMMLVK